MSTSHNALLSHANELTSQGQWRQAIESLSCHAKNDATLEKQLIELRRAGFSKIHWPTPQLDWPTVACDAFEGDSALIPEITPDDLNAATLASGIIGKGALIVRNLLTPEQVQQLKYCIDVSIQARRNYHQSPSKPSSSPWYGFPENITGGPVQYGKKQKTDSTGSMWVSHSPRSARILIELYKHLNLPLLLTKYFGEAPALPVRKWVMRKVAPMEGDVNWNFGWHQDGQFIGENIRTVNMWIPLSHCGPGTQATGLDIVAGNERKIYETGTHGAFLDWNVGYGLIKKMGNPIVKPVFQPGDALFFDHYNIHRTGSIPGLTEDRYAIETWFFAASTIPENQMPLIF